MTGHRAAPGRPDADRSVPPRPRPAGPLVVVGDALLDVDLLGSVHRVCPDAPVPVVDVAAEQARPGGAGLAAVLAARDGREVVLVTALADDTDGRRLRGLLDAEVTVVAGRWDGPGPVKTRVRAAGQSLLRLDRGGAGRPESTPAMVDAVRGAGAVLVSDYGGGLAADPAVREALADAARRVPVVWDPHPRGPEPVPGVHLVTPNLAEATAARAAGATAARGRDTGTATPLERAIGAGDALRERWQAGAVAVTLGSRGAVLCQRADQPLVVPAPAVRPVDPCGAGDRFAATAAGRLADGALPSEAVTAAVAAASRFVADGGAAGCVARPAVAAEARSESAPSGRAPRGAGPASRREAPETPWRDDAVDVEALVAGVRARGGVVVATGGCFDLLHVGHVRTLAAARGLGDCLVVLLNSDASVRRLKGPTRPVVDQDARAELLRALGCVDAVVVFDEDTPEAALDRLRPDVWVKGGDYPLEALPEAALVRGWGGRTVTVPYLDGHSTTRLAAGLSSTR